MVIEERAEQFARFDADCYRCCVYKDKKESIKLCPCKKFRDSYNLFFRIATEQQKIDIEKSTQLLIHILKDKLNINVDCNDIYQIVNDFKQAMKGE